MSPTIRLLNAGNVTLRLPDASSRTLVRTMDVYGYTGMSQGGNPLFIPDAGGNFQFSTSGGSDVGAFQTPVAAFPALNWTNKASITNVNRSSPLELTWAPGPANTFMVITGTSATMDKPTVATSFICTASAQAGRFTVPADVLSKMVPAQVINLGGMSFGTGQLSLALYSNPQHSSGPGLDIVSALYFSMDGTTVGYQ